MAITKNKIVIIENHALATATIRADLVGALVDNGYDVSIFTSISDIFDKIRGNGINIVDVGSNAQNPFSTFQHLRQLYQALKEYQPDVCLTFTIRPAIYGNLVTRVLKIPTITNITGIGPLFENNSLPYLLARFLYPKVLKKTRKIFFQNIDDMNIFLEKGFLTKEVIERIPGSGINYKKFNPRLYRKSSDGRLVFLFISRLVIDKGIFEYIEAARLVKQTHPKAKFHILGPLWKQNLEALTVKEVDVESWKKEGIVKYLGETIDVRDFVADADCIVLPSYREGTSNVLLEAASMAKPLIASNVTGCKEIIEDNVTGFLCKVKDPVDLAEKMERMIKLTEEEREMMGKRGRVKVIKEFDKQIVIDAYLKAVNEILDDKKGYY